MSGETDADFVEKSGRRAWKWAGFEEKVVQFS